MVITWEPPEGAPLAAAGEACLRSAAAGPDAEQPLAENGSNESTTGQHAAQLDDAQGIEPPVDTIAAWCVTEAEASAADSTGVQPASVL